MQGYAVAALGGPRWQALVTTMRFVGVDLTDADFRLQVRLSPNTPGSPLIDLAKVGTAAAEGVRLVSVEMVDGVPVSTIGIRVNETTMESLPFSGEAGESSVLAWDMQVTPVGGLKAKWIGGDFIVEAAVTGADAAAPGNGAYGWRQAPRLVSAGGGSFQFGPTVISVTLAGGQGPRGLASGPLGADSVGAEEINGADVVALQEKLGIAGQVVSLSDDLTIAEFSPRPGDAYQLNGHTLTIGRMVDTAQVDLFRGPGRVILSGVARPEWWQDTSYRAAAVALTAGGGGTVLLAAARYPSESSKADPLPISRVSFIGAAIPVDGPGFQRLIGGTVLEAPCIVASQDANGNALGVSVTFENLGIDAGSVVCAAATAARKLPDGSVEGLLFSNIGPGGVPNPNVPLREGIVVRRVKTLCRDALANGHGILIESAISPVIEECDTTYGGTGMVQKARKGVMRKCRNRGHGVAPGLIKSDDFSLAFDSTIEDCLATSVTGVDTGPYRIQAATAPATRNTFRDVRVEGTTQWISIETLGGNSNTDAKIFGGLSEGTTLGGITVSRTDEGSGVIAGLVIEGVTVNNVAQLVEGAEYIGNGIYLGPNVQRVNILASQIFGTAGDGVRSHAADVVVVGSTALAAGSGRHGFNAVAGSMKVPATSNIGTTTGAVAT